MHLSIIIIYLKIVYKKDGYVGNRIFTSIIRDTGRKKGLLSFYSVTICVCMYVCIRATAYII